MRLIDADALIGSLHNHAFLEGDDRSIVYNVIQKQPTVGGWISVKDRLPDDGVFVLVCNDDGHMMVAKYESEVMHWEYKYINYDWDVGDDEEQGPVFWWRPLPEPPKERDENDATDRR